MAVELIDNINQLLGDSLKRSITPGMKVKIAASCFSIYAFEALREELERIGAFEFIFTSPTFVPDEVTDAGRKVRREFYIPKAERERGFYGSEFEIVLKNKLTQRAIAKECAEWMQRKATFRSILSTMDNEVFDQFKTNPEDFILKAARIINEQKATVIVEHLAYDPIEDRHDISIFTQEKPKDSFAKAIKVNRHIYDYVFWDAKNEKNFVTELDTGVEVVVYAKLPRSFSIPTPVGNYNPDWAIAFEHEKVKHVYFIAETKGSMSTLDLREIEECKIKCARKFFAKISSEQVKYDMVDSYAKLMEIVK
jgi:restriction endonuclease